MKKYVLEIGEKEYTAELKGMTTEEVDIVVNGEQYKVKLKSFGRKKVSVPKIDRVERPVPAPAPPTPKPAAAPGTGGETVYSPLPGLILEVVVKEGDPVNAGQNLMVMEAMKMENQVEAPHNGVVKKVYVQKSTSVAEGDPLVEITRPLMTTI
ncbi:MAG: biotin/lipoyl-binding protein [bacterium]|nr:biotin/lipoyl-binding protein [bacterium]